MLVLAALLHGHGIPLAVLTGPAACRYLGGDGPGSPGLALVRDRDAGHGRACSASTGPRHPPWPG